MNPNTDIADDNTERLLQSASQPDAAPAEFASQLEKKLLETAQTMAVQRTTPTNRYRRFALVAGGLAACLLIVFAFAAGRRPQKVTHERNVEPNVNLARWTDDVRDGMMPRKRPDGPALAILKDGQSLTTKASERRLVQLGDGTRLYVNEKTEVTANSARQVTLHKGQIYLEVAPMNDGPRFVVNSAGREITATGTHFAVESDAKSAGVVVTQGKVTFGEPNRVSSRVEVTAGERIEPGADKATPAPRASHTLAWTRDLMAAAETPMVPSCLHAGGALLALDPQGQEIKLSLRQYHIDVHIEDGFTRTTIDQTYFNTTWERLEGTFYFPLPPDASLSRLAMYVVDGNGCKLMEGGMAERKHAADVYETIRYQRRDPALLEWLDGSTFKMRVFPLEAKQEKRIVLSYTQKLPALYGSTNYRFPGGHNMPIVREWSFNARIKSGAGMNLWSPSHADMNLITQGGDVLATAHAKNVKPSADVMLEMQDRNAHVERDMPRFASFVHENQTYLMLRYRPTLPTLPQRQRRDWIILFEASASRDPLLAGTQVDVVRQLLKNVEYDDTFTLLAVNSKVNVLPGSSGPGARGEDRPARPQNVAEAVQFLHETHLIGALDLQQGIEAAVKHAKSAKNPHILHIGSGTPAMGERDAAKLALLLPESVRYVGVGVGKRWNRAFMKAAAERTGGLFTQINPDEVIAWRAFELLATLNTPRLLDVQVVDATGKAPFLAETTMLAQGEDICAITRVENNQAMPGKVIVKGTLEGKAIVKEYPVFNVQGGAGYLARIWAKLQIDRLLTEGAAKNKDEIIKLSKAMYVMSPFTSLLVLETDADYARYNVDKGRKDHWAMYDCPAKIPLVYEPNGPAPQKPEVKKPGTKPTVEHVLRTIVAPERAEPASFSTIDVDPAMMERDIDINYMNDRIGEVSVPGSVNPNEAIGILGGSVDAPPVQLPPPGGFGANGQGGAIDYGLGLALSKAFAGRTGATRQYALREGGGTDSKEAMMRHAMSLYKQNNLPGAESIANRILARDPENVAALALRAQSQIRRNQQSSGASKEDNREDFLSVLGGSIGVIPLQRQDLAKFLNEAKKDGGRSGDRKPGAPQVNDEWRRFWMNDQPAGLTPYRVHGAVSAEQKRVIAALGKLIDKQSIIRGRTDASEEQGKAIRRLERTQFAPVFVSPTMEWAIPNLMLADKHSDYTSPEEIARMRSLRYERPTFEYDRTLFTNLLQYAPGLHTSRADILATLEQEADVESPKPGTIDPAARTLIDHARSSQWFALTIPAEGPLPSWKVGYNGLGQFAYERILVSGLREQVICDGKTLWHLYPEIGLAAKRSFSRHHHGLLTAVAPTFLPSADELARGHDVKAIDAATVALVAGVGSHRIHLVFTRDGRLSERQIVEMPAGKTMLRQIIHADGTLEWKGADDKTFATQLLTVAAAQAPDLTPKTDGLVVMEMPIRTESYFEKRSDPEQLLISKIVGRASSERVLHDFGVHFHSKGDRRLGFYTLLMAHDYAIGKDKLPAIDKKAWSIDIEKEHPGSALATLLAHAQRNFTPEPFMNPPGPKDGFIQRLVQFRNLWLAWHHQRPRANGDAGWPAEKARVIDFLNETTSPIFAYAILDAMQRRSNIAPSDHMLSIANKRLGPISNPLGVGYVLRYEHARALWQAGKSAEAIAELKSLHADTLKRGVLPPIDAAFRDVMRGTFVGFMRKTASDLIAQQRFGLAFQLAAQMEQIGDEAIAGDLLTAILANALPSLGTPDLGPGMRTGQSATEGTALTPSPSLMSTRERGAILTLLCADYLAQRKQFVRADRLVRKVQEEKKFAQSAELWRWRAELTRDAGQTATSIACLEKALELEYADLPELVNLESIRADYRALLGHYQKLADAMALLEDPARPRPVGEGRRKALLAKVIRSADRWRLIEPDTAEPCLLAGRIFHTLGLPDLAWDYWTTPIDLHPAESKAWLDLADTLKSVGDFARADRALGIAFETEPSNPDLLWQRAQNLIAIGETQTARRLYRQIAEGQWQERLAATVERARGLAAP